MHTKGRFPNLHFGASLRPDSAALAILVLLLFLIFVFLFLTLTAQPAQGQAFRVIHNFTDGLDGRNPEAGLTMDRSGNLYGTTAYGGRSGGDCAHYGVEGQCGTVFKLSKQGTNWFLTRLYAFQGGADGAVPNARVVIGPDGSLYGTTAYGGGSGCDHGCGTVFNLKPPATICRTALCSWTETVLYRFQGGTDGWIPSGDLIFDHAGSLYGTTSYGGGQGDCFGYYCGTVYKLSPPEGCGNGTEAVSYSFRGGQDGAYPLGGVIFDPEGNLYGTTMQGGQFVCDEGFGCGTIFQLTPSGSGWSEAVLYSFTGASDGYYPWGGLMLDQLENLYSTASAGGSNNAGTVLMNINVIHTFTNPGPFGPPGSLAKLAMDAGGNLYGTTYDDDGAGSVFKLTPSGGDWTYTLLHDFNGVDGTLVYSDVLLGRDGKLYGTASEGGGGGCYYGGCGVVWEITP
jgi:uncharacterized repeat protein (TIGR03803 family)